jgi:hypothetical protein
MPNKRNTDLELVQGDTFLLNVTLENVDLDQIEKVYFSCKELCLCKEFVRNGDVFELEISCDETCNLNKTICCYDITAVLAGNKVKTVEYRGTIQVLEKTNKVIL